MFPKRDTKIKEGELIEIVRWWIRTLHDWDRPTIIKKKQLCNRRRNKERIRIFIIIIWIRNKHWNRKRDNCSVFSIKLTCVHLLLCTFCTGLWSRPLRVTVLNATVWILSDIVLGKRISQNSIFEFKNNGNRYGYSLLPNRIICNSNAYWTPL